MCSLTSFVSIWLIHTMGYLTIQYYKVQLNITITLVNTQNASVTKIVDSSSIQRAETKHGLRIQFLALVVMIHEVWLNA